MDLVPVPNIIDQPRSKVIGDVRILLGLCGPDATS